ncbi:carboxypeptidase-like regulatory domain-containing protein [Flavobacterium sp.]|uniref:carboxypeptidase-like regulatory domain-containing protein n=1 Tax=Flavobacterium sp. TaxID=239 RepID=UPI0028BDBB9A|nr:carboxypeptidase-like regulatory domain-containing protein [Flavobacterium sp.]
MRNYFLLLLISLYSALLCAQEKNITVTLQNAKTKEVIAGASVSTDGSNVGAVSNDDGVFKITVPKSSNLKITHLSFKPIAVSVSDLKEENPVLFMEENDFTLEEVIISKTPIYQLLAGLIENSRAKLSNPIHLNTYCREFIKNHGKYTRFTDGLVDLHIKGKPKNIDVDAIALQNRSYGLNEEDEASDMLIGFSLEDIIEKTYEFGIIKKLGTKSGSENYDYEIKSNPSDENMYIIHLTPKSDVEELLYNVKIAYNINAKVILSIEYKIADSHLKYSKERNFLIARALIKKNNFKANFKFDKGKYLLSSTLVDMAFKIWNKRKINFDMEAKNALIVTDFKEETFSYDKKAVIKKGKLVKNGNNVKTNYWEFNSGLTPTAEEQAVIESLKNKQ